MANQYYTGENVQRGDSVRIGKGKVAYVVSLDFDPAGPNMVEIENIGTGRHRVIAAKRLVRAGVVDSKNNSTTRGKTMGDARTESMLRRNREFREFMEERRAARATVTLEKQGLELGLARGEWNKADRDESERKRNFQAMRQHVNHGTAAEVAWFNELDALARFFKAARA